MALILSIWTLNHQDTKIMYAGGCRQLKRELGDKRVGAGRQEGGSWETRGWELGDERVGAGRQGDGRRDGRKKFRE